MRKASLQLTYDGSAVKSGIMDARDLAIALVSVQNLCEQANLILNGQQSTLTVRVKARFKKGSFGISLDVVMGVIAQTIPILNVENYLTASAVVKSIFGQGGVLEFCKWLGGAKDAAKTDLSNGSVQVHVPGNNNTVSVTNNVYIMAHDPKIRKALDGTVRPLRKPGIEQLSVKSGAKLLQKVQRADVQRLSTIETEATESDSPQLSSRGKTKQAELEIVKLSFKARNKWVFSPGEQGNISATIEDHAFFDQVRRHEITFGKGDRLKVLLLESPAKRRGEKPQFFILKVLEVIPYPQTDLFD